MRRSAETLAAEDRAFLFNVPATWQTVAAQQLYVAELQRMGNWLVRMGGTAPDAARLTETLRAWDTARGRARALRAEMSARAFAEALIDLHSSGRFTEPRMPSPLGGEGGHEPKRVPGEGEMGAAARRASSSGASRHLLPTGTKALAERLTPPSPLAFPVALVGGPLLRDEFWLYDAIEWAGARVAFDATETGERGLAAAFDRRRLRDEPLSVLADAYFGQMPDAFRRPNTRLFEYLKSGFAERGVRAVILIRRVWCDLWHAEAARIRDWCGLPCISVDLSGEGDLRQRAATAVQALVEGAQ
jgi:hypothetical protein